MCTTPKMIEMLSDPLFPTMNTARKLLLKALVKMLQDNETFSFSWEIFLEKGGLKQVVALLRHPDIPADDRGRLFQIVSVFWNTPDNEEELLLEEAKNLRPLILEETVFKNFLMVFHHTQSPSVLAHLYQFLGDIIGDESLQARLPVPFEQIAQIIVSGLSERWKDQASKSSNWSGGLFGGHWFAFIGGRTVWESVLFCLNNTPLDHSMLLIQHGIGPALTSMLEKSPFCRPMLCSFILKTLSTRPLIWRSLQLYPRFLQVLSSLTGTTRGGTDLLNAIMDDSVRTHFQVIAYTSGFDYAWTSLAFLHADGMEGYIQRSPGPMKAIETALLNLISQGQVENLSTYLTALAAPFRYISDRINQNHIFPRWIHGSMTSFQDCNDMSVYNDIVLSVGPKRIPCHR